MLLFRESATSLGMPAIADCIGDSPSALALTGRHAVMIPLTLNL
jgi:hypothetical protein